MMYRCQQCGGEHTVENVAAFCALCYGDIRSKYLDLQMPIDGLDITVAFALARVEAFAFYHGKGQAVIMSDELRDAMALARGVRHLMARVRELEAK